MAMHMNFGLPTLPPFDAEADPTSLGTKWKSWRERLAIYIDAAGIESDKQKRALLLHLSGESVQKVFSGLTDTGDSYKVACDKLDAFFLPKKNIRYERYVFKQAKQEPGESVDQFATRLRTLSLTCEYENPDDAIADQVLEKCTSTRLKRRVLRDTDTSLASILQTGRAMERADTQVRSMEQPMSRDSHLNSLTSINNSLTRGNPYQGTRNKTVKSRSCFNCGGEWPHDPQRPCPAFGKTCNKCSKMNHFQNVCKSSEQALTAARRPSRNKTVRIVHEQPAGDESSSSDEEFTFVINGNKFRDGPVHSVNKQLTASITVAGAEIPMIIDSGASVNLIDAEHYAIITRQNKTLKLKYTNIRLYVYGSTIPLPILGKFEATIETASSIFIGTFFVVNKRAGSLLGHKTATDLGLITLHNLANSPVTSVQQTSTMIHKGHRDIVKTKQPRRQRGWYSNMDVENMNYKRVQCPATGFTNTPERLESRAPSKPWSRVSADICGPFPTGEYVLIVIDEYSRCPEVEILKSLSAGEVIEKLIIIFTRHDNVDELQSANGPPFNSAEFANFASCAGFIHRTFVRNSTCAGLQKLSENREMSDVADYSDDDDEYDNSSYDDDDDDDRITDSRRSGSDSECEKLYTTYQRHHLRHRQVRHLPDGILSV